MALNFPASPVDGQLYPSPAQPGIGQWRWSSIAQRWNSMPFYIQVQSEAYNNYLWPLDVGANGQSLTTNGSGGLSWGGTVIEQTIFKQLGILESFDGVNTSFTLVTFGTLSPYVPNPPDNLIVFLGGVPQVPNTYTIAGNTITFTEAPAVGAAFFAFTLAPNDPGLPVAAYVQPLDFSEAIDGVRVSFNLEEFDTASAFIPSPPTNLSVFLGGVPQVPVAAYSVSGSTVTFTEAPPIGSSAYAVSTIGAPGVTAPPVIKLLTVSTPFDGFTSIFTLVELGLTAPYVLGSSTNIVAFLGGVAQEQEESYSVSGSSIIFSEAPAAGSTFYAITCHTP